MRTASGRKTAGLTDQRLSVIVAVESYVSGAARNHLNALEAAKRTGVSDEGFWSAQAPFLTEAMQSGGFPSLAALGEDTFDVPGEQLFEFGPVGLVEGLADFVVVRAKA